MPSDREQSTGHFVAGVIVGAVIALCVVGLINPIIRRLEARRDRKLLDAAVRRSQSWDAEVGR
jgi:hypothetical protein